MQTTEDEESDELNAAVRALSASLLESGQGHYAHPTVAAQPSMARDWFHSHMTRPSAVWIGHRELGGADREASNTIALRISALSVDGQTVHGIFKTNRMTTQGWQAEESAFEASVAILDLAHDRFGFHLIGHALDGFHCGSQLDLKIAAPPAVVQKLRRSSSSDSHTTALKTREAVKLPRRASLSFVGRRSYAAALLGSELPLLVSANTPNPKSLKTASQHPPDKSTGQHDGAFYNAPAEDYPAPVAAETILVRVRSGRAAQLEQRHTKDASRPQMKGLLCNGVDTSLQYVGSMSHMEWQEGHFMRTGERRAKGYRQSSLAFQML